jgi:predicted SnoaL-like aldol condensation-catalyzing enzyme
VVTIFDISDDSWSLGLGRAQLMDLGSATVTAGEAGTGGIIYTEFPKDARKPIFTKPPAPVGTVEYNEWLGRMFNGVLFNESSPEKQKEIADQIVDEGYVQHNKLVETGREGLLAFARYVFQAVPDTRFIVHDVFATKDRVVTRWTWTGTLKGGMVSSAWRPKVNGSSLTELTSGVSATANCTSIGTSSIGRAP